MSRVVSRAGQEWLVDQPVDTFRKLHVYVLVDFRIQESSDNFELIDFPSSLGSTTH